MPIKLYLFHSTSFFGKSDEINRQQILVHIDLKVSHGDMYNGLATKIILSIVKLMIVKTQ